MKPLVLIAEGDSELRHLCETYLTERGYKVETVANGLECVEMLRQPMPGVLVLAREFLWGGSDGILVWLRDETALSQVAVNLTDPDGFPPDAAVIIGSPIVDYLPKPFALTTLLQRVQLAVTKQQREEHPDQAQTTARWELICRPDVSRPPRR